MPSADAALGAWRFGFARARRPTRACRGSTRLASYSHVTGIATCLARNGSQAQTPQCERWCTSSAAASSENSEATFGTLMKSLRIGQATSMTAAFKRPSCTATELPFTGCQSHARSWLSAVSKDRHYASQLLPKVQDPDGPPTGFCQT